MKSRKPIKRKTWLRSSRRPIAPRRADPQKRTYAKHRDPDYEKWIESLSCLVCGRWPVDPAHVEKRGRGTDDRENLLPLCREHHEAQEGKNAAFQKAYGLSDLGLIAMCLTMAYDKGCDADDVANLFGADGLAWRDAHPTNEDV